MRLLTLNVFTFVFQLSVLFIAQNYCIISRLVATLPDGPLFRDIAFRRYAKFVRMSAILTGMAVKVNFRMAAAAILDFAEREFLQQNRLWDTVFSPFAKFYANISHIIRRYSL